MGSNGQGGRHVCISWREIVRKRLLLVPFAVCLFKVDNEVKSTEQRAALLS